MEELKEILDYFHSENYRGYRKNKRYCRILWWLIYIFLVLIIFLLFFLFVGKFDLISSLGMSLMLSLYPCFVIIYSAFNEDLPKIFLPKYFSLKKDYDKYLERFRSHYSLHGADFRKKKNGFDVYRTANNAKLHDLLEYANSFNSIQSNKNDVSTDESTTAEDPKNIVDYFCSMNYKTYSDILKQKDKVWGYLSVILILCFALIAYLIYKNWGAVIISILLTMLTVIISMIITNIIFGIIFRINKTYKNLKKEYTWYEKELKSYYYEKYPSIYNYHSSIEHMIYQVKKEFYPDLHEFSVITKKISTPLKKPESKQHYKTEKKNDTQLIKETKKESDNKALEKETVNEESNNLFRIPKKTANPFRKQLSKSLDRIRKKKESTTLTNAENSSAIDNQKVSEEDKIISSTPPVKELHQEKPPVHEIGKKPFKKEAANEVQRNSKTTHVRKINWGELNDKRKSIGDIGELIVLQYEKEKLINSNMPLFASNIEHTSLTKGDGAGFDIASFDESGNKIYIEVKATKGDFLEDLFFSKNEILRLKELGNSAYLYRVYAIDIKNQTGKIKIYRGIDNLLNQLELKPNLYTAKMKKVSN